MNWFDKLFHQNGTNPNNIDLIVKRAVEIKIKIEYEGYELGGASGKYSHELKWKNQPKLSVKSSDGKKKISLTAPKSQSESKVLIALMYCVCYLCGKSQNTNIYYSDKQGLSTSIASKHGPEKSEYMKKLIEKMNDMDYINSLSFVLSRPLPENLSELHIAIIEAKEKAKLPDFAVDNLITKFGISCKELDRTLVELKNNPDVDNHRIPETIMWPNIPLPEHCDIVEDQLSKAGHAAEVVIAEIRADIVETITELSKLQKQLIEEKEKMDWLMKRGLFARLFNKQPAK